MPNPNHEPYPFSVSPALPDVYLFSTPGGAAYLVKLKHTPYLFADNPDLGEQVYELVVELIRPATGTGAADAAIGVTIFAICKDFFRHHSRILLYIFETADSRHLARVRKFHGWFRQFNDNRFLKIDTQFPESDTKTYYVSLIFE